MAQYIYVVLSKTHTQLGMAIRKVGNVQYNHASIALDEQLHEIYAFARQKHSAVFSGKLVKENISRFTLNKGKCVNVAIFKIPVSDEKHSEIAEIINKVYSDKEYCYNVLSLLTFPITKGISVYKAFTCIEFVMYILTVAGFKFSRPLCAYTPDNLLGLLDEYLYYDGDMTEYVEEKSVETDYFDPLTLSELKYCFVSTSKVVYRTVTLKKNELY